MATGTLSRCIVSTDNNEIADCAKALGADVPFMLPAAAATDTSKALAYFLHALGTLESNDGCYDAIMLLQLTSSIRNSEVIAQAVARMALSQSDPLISCYREEYINKLVMHDSQSYGTLLLRNPLHNKGVRRQEHGSDMVRNGALYVTRTSYLKAKGSLVCDKVSE